MLKFDLKNKFKLENKSNDSKNNENNIESDTNSEKERGELLKTEMISSILKSGMSGDEDKTVTFADMNAIEQELTNGVQTEQKQTQSNQNKIEITAPPTPQASQKNISPESEKISKLITAIESSQEKMIVPYISMDKGKISYPILNKIGVGEDNLDFLEKLTSPNFDILERVVCERLAVCPEHPESFSTNVRLTCARCNSLDITKLHLVEHKRCGYISENTKFEISNDGTIKQCPSCKKTIQDAKKEISIPAMWYTCNECNEKFDDVSVKLHCRAFNHDFQISSAKFNIVPGFKIKNLGDTSNASISPILKPLKNLLSSFGFSAEENHTVIGKSGNHYRINIYGEDQHKRTLFIFIRDPNAENDNTELNSKIIEVLDTSPTVTILIGFPSISEKAKTITANYNISILSDKDPDNILASIKDVLSNKVPPIEG
ncbi:MAG: hypothetical protein ACE5RN_01610 [Nitrosopumilaceae archaeon]